LGEGEAGAESVVQAGGGGRRGFGSGSAGVGFRGHDAHGLGGRGEVVSIMFEEEVR